jgi:Na+-translocating ferredoxin:NAD+ oxidoreductase RnfG subunit
LNWLASFVSALIIKLWPWLLGLISSGVKALINYFAKKKQDAEDKKQREEATKALEESIKAGESREERQKKEIDVLNS